MANVKITELTALTNPASSDVLPIVDVGADTTKKVTIADLLENAGSGTASAAAFAFDGDADTGMYRTGANALGFTTGGTGRLFIDSSGNCGVNTSSPLERLHVKTGASGVSSAISGVDGVIIESGASRTGGLLFYTPNDRGAGIFFGDPDNNNKASYKYNHSTDSTEIISNGSQRLTINSSGNVGIGTSSPATPLHVQNNDNAPGGYIQRWSADLGVNNRNANLIAPEADDTSSPFTFFTNSSWNFRIDAIDALTIDAACNVGIRTTSPDERLEVGGNIKLSNTSTRLIFEDSDSANLTVNRFTSYDGALIADVDPSNNGSVSSTFRINIDGSESARIDSSGRLLVGHSSTITTTPIGAAQVQIVGTNNPSSQLSISRFSDDTDRPRLSFIKSRSGTKGTNTIVQEDDNLGDIMFMGADGSATNDYIIGAIIGAAVDGTPAADDMPSRIVLATTASGSSSPTERMRISSAGVVTINSGFVTLNGSKVGGIQVTIADDAFAEITPPKAGAGFVAVTEGPDEAFPNTTCNGFVFCDWGDSPHVSTIHVGSLFEVSNQSAAPTGTTGSDAHATLFAGGTSGKVYLENRLGTTGIFALTFT